MRQADWFDGQADGERDQRRPRWFPILVAVPWLVVAGLLVAPTLGDPEQAELGNGLVAADSPTPDHPGTPEDPEAGSGTEQGGAAPPVAESDAAPEILEVQELRGAWRVAPGSEESASLAVVVARAALTGLGPRLPMAGIEPPEQGYAEHLVVEAIERTSPETEVVTVLAITLQDTGEAEASANVSRLAVPIAWTDQGPRPAGAPWPLPAPELDLRPPPLVPITDDLDAWDEATSALALAGLGTYPLTALHQAPDGPLVATISDGSAAHDVWLRPHLGGYVVAGTTLRGADQSATSLEQRP